MLDSIALDEGPLEVGVDVVEVVGVIVSDFDFDFEVTAVLDRLVEDEGLWEDDKAEVDVTDLLDRVEEEIEDADEDTGSINSSIFFGRPFRATFAGLADGLPVFTVMSVEGRRAFEVPCEASLFVVGWGNVAVWEVEIEVSPDPLIGRAGMAVLECWTEAVEEGGGGEEATHELSDI